MSFNAHKLKFMEILSKIPNDSERLSESKEDEIRNFFFNYEKERRVMAWDNIIQRYLNMTITSYLFPNSKRKGKALINFLYDNIELFKEPDKALDLKFEDLSFLKRDDELSLDEKRHIDKVLSDDQFYYDFFMTLLDLGVEYKEVRNNTMDNREVKILPKQFVEFMGL